MKIWYLWEGDTHQDSSGSYDASRLREVGRNRGHEVQIFTPDQFKLTIGAVGHPVGHQGANESENAHGQNKSARAIFVDGQMKELPDIVISRIYAGSTELSMTILRHLQACGVAVVNAPQSISQVIDKIQMLQILDAHGIAVPKTLFSKCPIDLALIEREIGFPVVVKTLKGARGGGVFLCQNAESVRDVSDLLVSHGLSAPILLQKYVSESHGRDIRAYYVGGKVVACMERTSTDGSFKSNIARGGIGEPCEMNDEMRRLVQASCAALKIDIAAVDLLMSETGYLVCGVNSSPNLHGVEKYAQFDIVNVIYDYIDHQLIPQIPSILAHSKEQATPKRGAILPAFLNKLKSLRQSHVA